MPRSIRWLLRLILALCALPALAFTVVVSLSFVLTLLALLIGFVSRAASVWNVVLVQVVVPMLLLVVFAPGATKRCSRRLWQVARSILLARLR